MNPESKFTPNHDSGLFMELTGLNYRTEVYSCYNELRAGIHYPSFSGSGYYNFGIAFLFWDISITFSKNAFSYSCKENL